LTFEVYSNANLSNIFAQTAAFVFFVWWAGGKPGGWPVGALFLIAGFYGHLSILIFLVILVASLLLCHRRELAEHRQGVVAVLVGLVGAALYYFQFHEMIFEQLPRLLEGGRGGAGARGLVDSLLIQLNEAINQWGVPVIVLAILGKWRSGRLDNSLKAYWMAGAVLAIAAVVSPMEVRYQYALVLPLAISAAEGARFLVTGGMRQSGLSGWLVLLGWGLLGAQTALGIHGIANALLYAWRV